MRLRGDDGSELTLAVDSYKYPAIQGVGSHDWDANWLVVSGDLKLPDGRDHSFADPCLTTWEAQELKGWLHGLAEGQVGDIRVPDVPTLTFTEPCLAFAATQLDEDKVELRVYLSLEIEPPFVIEGRHGIHENFLPLSLSRSAVGLAAAEWSQEVGAFPVRGTA